jgi:hypothetical protein
MPQSSNNQSPQPHLHMSETQSSWMWLMFAALLVIGMVFGYLHAGRAFWRVSGLRNESALASRA